MSAKSKLKRALNAIDDAQRVLRRAKNSVEDNQDIRRAIRELDDAEADIKRAMRDVDQYLWSREYSKDLPAVWFGLAIPAAVEGVIQYGNHMTEAMAKNKLEQLIERVESIMELSDHPHPGVDEYSHPVLISKLYSSIKWYMDFYLGDLEAANLKGNLEDIEKHIVLPAVQEAARDLNEPMESMNLELIYSCLYGASSTLRHYRSQLNV